MKRVSAWLVVAASVAVVGCATKNNGRVYPVSLYETQAYDCQDVALELAKLGAYQQAIIEESQFGWRTVGGFSADLGLGNYLERRDAEAAGERRRLELEALARQRGCTPGHLASGHSTSAHGYPAIVSAPAAHHPHGQSVAHVHHAQCGHALAGAVATSAPHVHPGRAAADAYR